MKQVSRRWVSELLRSTRALAIAALSSGVLAACSTMPTENKGEAVVTAQVSRTSFHAGDSVLVSITIANAGEGLIFINSFGCERFFDILKGDNVIVSSMDLCARVTAAVGHSPLMIRPGKSHTVTYNFQGQNEAWAVQLNPGNYAIRGAVFVGNNNHSGTPIRSEPIAIEILDK